MSPEIRLLLKTLFVVLLSVLLLVGLRQAAQAATIRYVAPGCADNIVVYDPTGAGACTGGSARSYSTITNAFNAGISAAGDIIDIRAGTYLESLNHNVITFPVGTAALPVTVRGHAGETVTIRPPTDSVGIEGGVYIIWDHLVLDGVNGTSTQFRNGISLGTGSTLQNSEVKNFSGNGCEAFANSITVKNNLIHTNGSSTTAGPGHGCYMSGQGGIYERNTVYDNYHYGFHLYDSGSSSVSGNIIRFNHVEGNAKSYTGLNQGGFGILLANGSNNVAYANFVKDNGVFDLTSGGIQVDYSCTDCFVYNNTVMDNAGGSAGIAVGSQATRTTVKNNALSGNRANYSNSGASTTIGTNACSNSGGTTGCSVSADSLGLNSDGTVAAGSALIDAGASSIGSCPPGFNCTYTAISNGPLPDIGAFETIPFASAAATTTSVLDVTFGSAYAPLSTVASCANVTVRQAGATKTCSTFTNNGAATYRWTCAACLSSGGGTIDIAISAGKFTDAALVGNALNQGNFALPVTTVTNNIAGTTEVFTSRHFQQRKWARQVTDTGDAAWIKGQDITGVVRVDGGKFSAWWLVDCTIADCPSVGFQFEFNLNGGAWANVTDSCVTNAVCFDSTNSAAPHGTVIQSCQLTDSFGNCLSGAVAAQASGYPVLNLALNQSAPIQMNGAIKSGLVAGTDQFCIRPKLDSGAAVSHAVTACFDVINPSASPS